MAKKGQDVQIAANAASEIASHAAAQSELRPRLRSAVALFFRQNGPKTYRMIVTEP
jgi:hypothetical protein